MLKTLLLLTAVIVAPAFSQDLPDGPGKDTTVRVCTSCHGEENFAGYHKSSDDWDSTIESMTERGLSINDQDYSTVLNYLAKCLGVPASKINVNTASACELTTTLGVSPGVAGAIVDYRTKNGNFKDVDGLKKVDGIDAAAIDAKKAKIQF